MTDTNENGLFNSSISKGLCVLEAFDRGQRSLSLTQLVAITGLEKSGVQRFTATLVSLGYLRKDPTSRQYSLSPLILHLGSSYLRNHPLVERASPLLLDWNRSQNETVNLGELDGMDVIIIYRYRSRQAVSPSVVMGSKFPWYATSIGQAMVAQFPESQQKSLIKRTKFISRARKTITNPTTLLKRLEQVRRDGFAFCHEEVFDTDISVAAPVFGPSGEVIAGVAAAVLATQWSVQNAREQLGPSIRELARAVSSSSQTRPRAQLHPHRHAV